MILSDMKNVRVHDEWMNEWMFEAENEKRFDIYLADLEVQVALVVPVLNHLMKVL